MEHKYQTYEPHREPSSEFEGLVKAISELENRIVSYLEELNSLYARFTQTTPGTTEECDTEARMSKMAADMERQYQQIDRHYGWVLAIDHALVNEVLRSRFGRKIDGETWLKITIEERKAIRRLLVESAHRAFKQNIKVLLSHSSRNSECF